MNTILLGVGRFLYGAGAGISITMGAVGIQNLVDGKSINPLKLKKDDLKALGILGMCCGGFYALLGMAEDAARS